MTNPRRSVPGNVIALICLALIVTVSGCLVESADSVLDDCPPMPRLVATRGDAAGVYDICHRQVVLRGVNFNHLGDYFAGAPGLPPVAELSAEDWDGAAATGANVIRLVTSWSFWEPAPGEFDQTYLQRVRDAVAAANARGMYVVIDMHQDAWGKHVFTPVSETCPPGTHHQKGWDGAPEWATFTDGLQTCTPDTREESPAVIRAWENFYQNREGIQDRLAVTWGRIAAAFAADDGVAGYDLLNEPGVGERSTVDGLTRFYRRAIEEIRAAEAGIGEHIIFFEPALGELPDLELSDDPNLVFAPHNYFGSILTEYTVDDGATLYETLAKAYDTTLWIGEFGSFRGTPEQNDAWYRRFAEREDDFIGAGSAWWQWEQTSGDPHSIEYPPSEDWLAAHQDDDFRNPRGTFHPCMARPYPRAAPGRLQAVRTDNCGGPLEIEGVTSTTGTARFWYPREDQDEQAPCMSGTGFRQVAPREVTGGWLIDAVLKGAYSVAIGPEQCG
ncbi:MAG: glycosidase [Candidatus Dadabacteria bacterium]|nr:MAG: glycosidase [Candidatus Dadabacteria bacterium]